jgi:hypothetical protein
MFDACTMGDTVHIDTIFKFLSHTRQHACIDILHCCNNPCLKAHRTSPVVNFFFSFTVAVNNPIKVDPLVFLLSMFVITENVMKCPVLLIICMRLGYAPRNVKASANSSRKVDTGYCHNTRFHRRHF